MTMLSAIVPSFEIQGDYGKTLSRMMESPIEEIVFYKVERIIEEEIDDYVRRGGNIGFRIESYQCMNMKNILSFVEENSQLKIQIDRLKESLIDMTKELRKVYKLPAQIYDEESNKFMKKMRKIKSLEEENKNLKHIIKSQLETSDKLKAETYTTVEALKDEFENLIDELQMTKKAKAHHLSKKPK